MNGEVEKSHSAVTKMLFARKGVGRMEDFFEKVKSLLIKIGVGFVICCGWMALTGILLEKVFEIFYLDKLGILGIFIEGIIGIPVLMLPIIIIFLVKGYRTRCTSCKKLFAMKEKETKFVACRPKYITVLNNTYSNYSGQVTQQSEQRILGTEKKFETRYVCKYCNAEEIETFCRETNEPWME